MEFKGAAVVESQKEASERDTPEACEVVSQESVDHTKNRGFPHTIGAVQESDTVLQVKVYAMVVDAEELVYLNALKSK